MKPKVHKNKPYMDYLLKLDLKLVRTAASTKFLLLFEGLFVSFYGVEW